MSSLKRLREYCYTKDYKFYHNDGKTFTQITRKEYKEKTGESDYIIDKLRNSLGPYQWNDYFFLVPPTLWTGKKNTESKPAPIDWKLINLVKYFIKNNFFTSGIEQGPWGEKEVGYIVFIKFYPEFLSFIQEKFGKENVIQLERTWNWDVEKTIKNPNWYNSQKKIIVMKEKNIHTNKEKVLTTYYKTWLIFPINMIKFMHKKLNLEFPDYSKAHKGNRIFSDKKLKK